MDNLYNILLENMTFPVWVKNIDGKFIFVNESFLEYFGNKRDYFIGKTFEEVFSKELLESYNNHCDEVIKLGISIKKEIDNGEFYVERTVLPLKNSEGDIESLAGIILVRKNKKKINEIKQIVKEQNILTKRIIDTLPGTIFYKDVSGRYIYANEECVKSYSRLGVNDILGKTDNEINPNKAQVKAFIEDDKKIIETRLPVFNTVKFNNGDGTSSYREVIKVPLVDKYGNLVGIVGRALDVTEQKTLEDKLEYLSYTDVLTGVKNRVAFDIVQKKLSRKKHLPLCIVMGDVNGLKVVNDTFGHIEGDRLLIQIANIIKDVIKDIGEVFRFGGDEFIMLIPNYDYNSAEKVVEEINKRCEENNENLYNLSIALGFAVKKYGHESSYTILKDAEEIVYRKKIFDNNSIKNSILNSLKVGLEVNSEETEEHNKRVLISCENMGKALNLNSYQIDELKLAAELHDIGMIGVNREIVLKKSKLTEEEFESIKSHTEKGYRIIKASNELKKIAETVLYHHERWDGHGYPMGLKSTEIPLYSRIIAICDAYDGMTNDKVYKKAMSIEEAIDELKRCKGTQFDPELTDIFIEILL